MPRKKTELTEAPAAPENEDDRRTEFPKVAANAKIKSITREIDLLKVKFKDLTFSPGQEPQLCDWMDNEDELLITIEQFQGRL